jgi:hypothetical protein
MNSIQQSITSLARPCSKFSGKNLFVGVVRKSSLLNHTLLKVSCIISVIAFLLSPNFAKAQTKAKRVLGTFVYLGTAYNYEFKKNDINNYSFTISSLTATTTVVTPATTTPAPAGSTVVPANTTPASNPAAPTILPKDTQPKPAINVPPVVPANTAQNSSVTANANGTTNTDYIFDEFTRDVFVNIFCTQMHARYSAVINDALTNKSLEIFFNVQTKIELLDDEPVTAHMILKKDNISSFLLSNTSVYYDYSLSDIKVEHKIKDVNMETEDGAIKNVIVYLVNPRIDTNKKTASRGALEFKNAFPVSISGKHDPERFSDIRLNCYNCGGIAGLNRYIRLADLLELDITLANDKEDYSPANTTFALNSEKSIVELRKEKRSQILSVAAFSDFVGLDQEQPNGLIQIEAKRKININTLYRPIHKTEAEDVASKYDLGKYDFKRIASAKDGKEVPDSIRYQVIRKDSVVLLDNRRESKKVIDDYNARQKNEFDKVVYKPIIADTNVITNDRFKSGYYLFFAAIEPKLLFSKLDGNKKFAVLDATQSANKRTDPLSVFQHQLVSFGINLTGLKFFYPQSKLSWNVLDLGAFWYSSRVQALQDTSTKNSVSINNGYFSATSTLNFKPDSRWGANLGLTYIKQKSFNSEYLFERNKGLFHVNFDAFIKTNDESKVFFRFRWVFDEHTLNKNFTQVQLGYSLNIFANGSPSK